MISYFYFAWSLRSACPVAASVGHTIWVSISQSQPACPSGIGLTDQLTVFCQLIGGEYLFGLTSCVAKPFLRTFVRKLYSVHCVHTVVSTEEMFSAAKYFKYIPDHV